MLIVRHEITQYDIASVYWWRVFNLPVTRGLLGVMLLIVAFFVLRPVGAALYYEGAGHVMRHIVFYAAQTFVHAVVYSLLFLVVVFGGVRLMTRMLSRNNVTGPAEISMDEDGVYLKSAIAESRVAWTPGIRAVMTPKHLLVIFPNGAIQPVLRTPENEETLEAMRGMVEGKITTVIT